jgi:8-oxo-dGTP diphosphatase
LPNFLYTLCFLTFQEKVLLLYRNHPPNAGLWNGVGGHIEFGETPHEACLREVHEETGFLLPSAQFIGILTWQGFEINDGGLVLFKAAAPDKNLAVCSEGLLSWQSLDFLYRSPKVVANLNHCSPHFMNGAPPLEYRFIYHNNRIVSHTIRHIPQEMSQMHLNRQNIKPV